MWIRDLPAATIHIIKRSYTLAPTAQKRQIIRTSWGEYIATRPFLMKDGQKLTMGPSVLYFLPESSIKALPEGSPGPVILVMPEYGDLHLEEEYNPYYNPGI